MKSLPDVAPVLQTAFAFWSSKVLLTAVEFGVFTRLADRKLTAAELGGELELHPRGWYDFFDALVAMGFLAREGNGPSARYHNTEAGRLYLDAASPATVYAAIALFLLVRLLDDFVFMPLTIGRSLQMHPLVSVLLLFIGGAVAGVLGLVIVLPLAGVVMIVVDCVARILLDRRLMARYAFARRLRSMSANADLKA